MCVLLNCYENIYRKNFIPRDLNLNYYIFKFNLNIKLKFFKFKSSGTQRIVNINRKILSHSFFENKI